MSASIDKDLLFLADFLEQYYVLPYTHDELLDLLSRIKNGYFLSKEEYEALRSIILGDSDDNIDGDLFFSGDYRDLKNKPYIPKKLSDLNDYTTFMAIINSTWAELKDKDALLEERISDNARIISAVEVVLSNDVERLEKLIEACKMIDGSNLEDILINIQGELGWLEVIKQDVENGKVLSEKDFTAEYEEILRSINNTAEGFTGYIKKVIAESIVDPGHPNGNGNYRMDSIGEALATKVDKVYGYGLSQNDFSNKYKEILDNVLDNNGNGNGTLQEYVLEIVKRYEDEFLYMINDLGDRMNEYTENEIQKLKKELAGKFNSVDKNIEDAKNIVSQGATFKTGDGPSTVAVGGLDRGAILEGKSVREVLLDILCPFTTPHVFAELKLAPHCNYLAKIGSVVEIKGIVANIEKGSLPVARINFKRYNGNDYDLIGSYGYSDYQGGHWFPDILEITQSIPNDHFIVEAEDIQGNTTIMPTQAIDIVYPIYYGSLKSEEISANSVKYIYEEAKRPGTECTIKYTTNNQSMIFAIPQGYGTVTEILDQNGYVITNSFDTVTITMSFEVKEVAGNSIQRKQYKQNYFVYYNNPSTVTGFEVTYKF